MYKIMIKPLWTRLVSQTRRRPIRKQVKSVTPRLEALEERWCPATVTYEWRPQLGSMTASDGKNWYNTTTKTTGVSPLTGGGVAQFDGAFNSPITWDTGGNLNGAIYDVAKVTLQNGYTSEQEIGKGVTINTGAVSSARGSLLNLLFDGPQAASPSAGSYFYVGTGANSIADWYLVGSQDNHPSGNFVIDPGASLTIGNNAVNATEPVSNTVIDVQGTLNIQPSATGSFAPIALQSGAWLRAENVNGSGGTITMQDQGYIATFVSSDGNANNTIFVDPFASLTVYCNVHTGDTIGAPILDNGTFTVYGGTSQGFRLLNVQGSVNPAYGGHGGSVDVEATSNWNAYVNLWNQVKLDCQSAYRQYGIDSTHEAILQVDTSGEYIQSDNADIFIGSNTWVIFATTPQPYGTLTLISSDVDWQGGLQTEVDEEFEYNNPCDVIAIQGNVVFSNAATIAAYVNNYRIGLWAWQIFTCTGTWTGWSGVQVPSGWSTGSNGYIRNYM